MINFQISIFVHCVLDKLLLLFLLFKFWYLAKSELNNKKIQL